MRNYLDEKPSKDYCGTPVIAPVLSKNKAMLVWVNIAIQLFLPLSLSLTPTIATAQRAHDSVFSNPTERYTLGVNETIDTVAKKLELTVDDLKKINRYRLFPKPFEQLTTGDEIDIPRTVPLLSIDNMKNNHITPASDTQFASHVQSGAAVLANDNTAKSAERMLRSAANNELNASTQQWLSQFGTARVQLNIDDNFSLNNSNLDVLVPLYDNQKSMAFTQLGARNTDSRNTINIGAGLRTVHNDWMYGVNTFFDNDLTGKNQRIGFGTEAWTDYLKLSANSYFRTSDWHQSHDFADYNERPANGYDVRAEAYLPFYPQVGGKMMYEKYRGNDVALLGKDQRQKNPHALTAGINYTPFPLLTVGADHRMGKGSQSNSNISAQLNYRLGESWRSHINPSAVAASRTLAGSRYDLVERNNNIVLDYQKKVLLHLTLPEQITGQGGSATSVTANVTSKYTIDRIEWDSSALTSAGGSLSSVSVQTADIRLPPYQLTRGGQVNTYTLSAVAYDTQGNMSPRATLRITVMPGEPTLSAANLAVTQDNAVADGLDTNAVQAVVTDAGSNPLSGQVVTFLTDNGATVTNVAVTTNAKGIASTTLTNTQSGVTTVTARLANNASHQVETRFVADDRTAQITATNLTVTRDNALADGVATNSVQAIVTDANNNTLAGQAVTFTADNGATATTVVGTTSAEGIASATLTNTQAGTATVTATLTNNASQHVGTRFVADDRTAQIAATNLTVTRDNALADGVATNSVQAIVTDANHNPLAGQAVTFTADNGATVTTVVGTTTAEGIASATLTNTNAGQTLVTARLDNNASQSVKTTFAQDLSIFVETTADNAIAGEESNTVKARVVNALGSPVANVNVDFSSDKSGIRFTPPSGTTNSNGEVTSSVSRDFVTGGQFTVIASISEQADNDTATVNFLTLRPVNNIIAPYDHTFLPTEGFPTTGHPGARFTINASGNEKENINYAWSSSNEAAASIDSEGNITLSASSLNKSVSITAKDSTYAYRYEFKITRWFSRLTGYDTYTKTQEACKALGMHVPDYSHLTKGKDIRGIGSLWSEWARPSNWPGGDVNTGYWTRTTSSPGYHYVVLLKDGSSNSRDPSSAFIDLGVCTQS